MFAGISSYNQSKPSAHTMRNNRRYSSHNQLNDFKLDTRQELLNKKIIEKKKTMSSIKGRRSRMSRLSQNNNPNSPAKTKGALTCLLFREHVELSTIRNANFKKTKQIEFFYYKYLYNTLMQCVFALISIFSGILSYEIEYDKKKTSEVYLNVSLWFCFISSLFLWVTIIYDYLINCEIMALNKKVPAKVWHYETNNLIYLGVTFAFFFFHPNPVFNGVQISIYNHKFEIEEVHSLNSIFLVIMLLRLGFFFKFYLVYSEYQSPRTQRVCRMNGFDTSLHFSLKANMLKEPYIAYVILFLIILVYCSFCLRIFERVLDEHSGRIFSIYLNAMWCLIITMTTVGYGDYFPCSTLGRAIGIMSCICGVFLISMLIVTITNILQFQGTEENVYTILQRLKLTEEKDKLAAGLVVKYIHLMKGLRAEGTMDKQIDHLNKKEKARLNLLLMLHYFNEKNVEIEATYPAYSNPDFIKDNLEMLDSTINKLEVKYENIERNLKVISDKLSSFENLEA